MRDFFSGFAYMAVLSALFVVFAVITMVIAVATESWFMMAQAGIIMLASLTMAMLSLRE